MQMIRYDVYGLRGWVCLEDLGLPYLLRDGMVLRIGHVTKGPEVVVGIAGGVLQLAQGGPPTLFQGGPVEIGRRGPATYARYNLDVGGDIATRISRTHALIERRRGDWFLSYHPRNPKTTDFDREQCTWMLMGPERYTLPLGARDGRVAVIFDTLEHPSFYYQVLLRLDYADDESEPDDEPDEPPDCVTVRRLGGGVLLRNAPLPAFVYVGDQGDRVSALVLSRGDESLLVEAKRDARGERSAWVCLEDLGIPYRIEEDMLLRVGHMARGPEITVSPAYDSIRLTQKGVETEFSRGAIEIGNGSVATTYQRYPLDVDPDVSRGVQQLHALIVWADDGWYLRPHPRNPNDVDPMRLRSTWMRMDPGRDYDLPVGYRDNRVAVLIQNAAVGVPYYPVLIEPLPCDGINWAKVQNLSGSLVGTTHIAWYWTGADFIDAVATMTSLEPYDITLVKDQHVVHPDVRLDGIPGLIDDDALVTMLRTPRPLQQQWITRVEVDGAEALARAPQELRSDRHFLGRAVRVDGNAIRHASPELMADASLQRSAVEQDALAIRHFAAMANDELWELAAELNPRAVEYRPRA